ncbi:Pkinase-domain-containing protein [Pholiota molesta]|nr:Pkinase-domain-containing protein [Pholiota molesta]
MGLVHLFSLPDHNHLVLTMLRLWPSSPPANDQLTPRPAHLEKNPFNDLPLARPHSSPGPQTPTSVHPLLAAGSSPLLPSSAYGGSAASDLTPLASPFGPFTSAQPTTHLSIHAPDFKMQQPPLGKKSAPSTSTSTSTSTSSASSATPSTTPPQVATSKGQLHVKLIQSRGLNVRSIHAKPYVVVQFEQNEFVSRDPIAETDKEVKGTPVNLSRQTSSNAISALGAIGSKAAAHDAKRKSSKGSKEISPSSSLVSAASRALLSPSAGGISNGLLGGRLSAHNPVWKHEVSFDVTSEESLITLNVYDRAVSDQGFLGTIQIKPLLIHDHTVDQWYKLRPFEDEILTRVPQAHWRGTFGKVFQVRKKDTKRIYAMKVLSKKEIVAKKEVAHTIGERKILQRSWKRWRALLAFAKRDTLFRRARKFYIAELILALEHLHKYNIVYRDLKPENILLDATGHVALCDFGLSKADLRPDELTTTFCGTTEYLAPEILLDEHGYSKIVDFWSLGVLLFEMCCGWSPFYAEDTQQMYKNICFGKIRFPKGVINDDGKQFVKGLLNRNPKHRLGAQRDAAELKEHPFFKNIDWEALSLKQSTPPFKPVVESDESTSNFDPEFTSADLREVGGIDMMDLDNDLDDNDPSEAWVSQSISGMQHQPNGPLGSASTGGNGGARPQGIQIKPSRVRKGVVGSPLTNSVQENFIGFTYHGGESVAAPRKDYFQQRRAESGGGEEEAVADEDAPEVTTEDEFEDAGRSAGRYAITTGSFPMLARLSTDDDDNLAIIWTDFFTTIFFPRL